MTRFFSLLFVSSLISICYAVTARAVSSADAMVEYACGTEASNPVFTAESGFLKCDDGSKPIEQTSTPNSKNIFCFYTATCTPVTTRVKRKVLEATGKTDWSKLSDDEINQTIIKLASNPAAPLRLEEVNKVAVQCQGSKTEDGNPDCPRVNRCINKSNAGAFFNIKALRLNPNPSITDSSGFGIEKSTNSPPLPIAPRGVVK